MHYKFPDIRNFWSSCLLTFPSCGKIVYNIMHRTTRLFYSSTTMGFLRRILKFKNSTNNEKLIAKYRYPLGITPMCLPKKVASEAWAPSAINIKPIKIKNANPSICIEGCFSMNFLMPLAKAIMMIKEMTTAMIIKSRA